MEQVPGQNKRNIYLTLHENDTNEDATIKLVIFNENANYYCELGKKDILRISGKLDNFNFVEHTPRPLPINLGNQHENISTIEIFDNVNQAIKSCITNSTADDTILVFGSFFLIQDISIDFNKVAI